MKDTVVEIEMGRTARAQALLEALPDDLYEALPSAGITVDVCSHVVSRAIRSRNPGIVREWLDYERRLPQENDLLRCLDLALESQVSGLKEQRTVELVQKIRSDARDALAGPATDAGTESVPALVDGVLIAIGAVNESLYRHSLDVSAIASRLAKAVCLPTATRQRVAHIARVHEVGRLRIDRDVLESTMLFDDAQRLQIRARLADVAGLGRGPLMREIADSVYDVYMSDPLMAADEVHIVRVADAFVSMCEARPYRKALSPHQALDQLWQLRGARFDSRYVEVLVRLLGYERRYARSA